MVEMEVIYDGQLHCVVKHGPSGHAIATDAPKDNQGRGESFSPTDLVAGALGSCMLTIMGVYAQSHKLNLAGMTAVVAKEMTGPGVRRIAQLNVTVKLPKTIPADQRQALENAARACPVAKSLHPEIEQKVKFVYE